MAATALAQTLLENDPASSILILDVGQRVKTKDFGIWENYLVTGQLPYSGSKDLPYPARETPGENENAGSREVPLEGARLFAYGGSTHHWGGWSFRLKPEDFRLKSNTGEGLDWPFDYDSLEPYYCRAEEHLAVSGDSEDTLVRRSRPYPFAAFPMTLEDEPIAGALNALKIGYGHLPIARRGVSAKPSRHAPCQTTGTCKYCPFGARYVACNYLDDLREWNDFPNLRVELGAMVLAIRMNGKRRAEGVLYIERETGKTVAVDAERVVIAAGAIESANLLRRSATSEWEHGIGNDADLVGRHLTTHPYFTFSAILPSNPLRLQPEMDFPTLVSRHFDSPEEQRTGKFMFIAPPRTVDISLARLMQSGATRAAIDAKLTGPNTITIQGMLEVFGRFENRVSPMRSTNRFGLPMTSVCYKEDAGFTARMKEIETKIHIIFNEISATPDGQGTVSWRADHAASVCRMGMNEAEGVVDPNLRVHGVDNLYVISNGVFPNLGAVNPTLTLTALALRLGDHLCDTGVG
ncbi:MAG: GMC family oxidoreductase [Rhizobiaceae bacterium]